MAILILGSSFRRSGLQRPPWEPQPAPVGAGALGRNTIFAGWRSNPAPARKVILIRVAIAILPAESNVLFGHPIKGRRSIPGFEREAGTFREIWRSGDRVRSIDWGQQHQIAPGIVQHATTKRQSECVLFEPEAVVEHPAQEGLLEGSDLARRLLVSKTSRSPTVFTSQIAS